MISFKLAKPILVALAACAIGCGTAGAAFADDAETQALKDQMRLMQQQMQQLQQQLDNLSKKQAAAAAAQPAPVPAPPTVAKQGPPPEPAFEKFAKGFYGTLDVSSD